MSLSLIDPPGSRDETRASSPQARPRRTGVARASQADAVWILAATVVFVGFQVFALLTGGP
jgi:hypothetical protein